jgi:hypothetical protein
MTRSFAAGTGAMLGQVVEPLVAKVRLAEQVLQVMIDT